MYEQKYVELIFDYYNEMGEILGKIQEIQHEIFVLKVVDETRQLEILRTRAKLYNNSDIKVSDEEIEQTVTITNTSSATLSKLNKLNKQLLKTQQKLYKIILEFKTKKELDTDTESDFPF